jgi:hypothetical protein
MTDQHPHFIRTASPLDSLSDDQRRELQARLEEGFDLRNTSPRWFSLLAERAEWDLAVVLDACRYDVFAETNTLPGRLERRVSPGSCTEDWIAATFEGRMDDVVYVSATPYVSRWYMEQIGMEPPFAHIEEVWQSGWDDSLHTVPPRAVADAWRRLRPALPGKKFVLHFMQPHHPYIGKVGVKGAGWRKYFGAMETDQPELEGKTPTEMLADGEAQRDEVLAAYRANLELVLEVVADIVSDQPGRMVVTADHGEAFGECGIYGHPPGLLMPELICVPYLRLV